MTVINVPTYTINQLEAMNVSKADLFAEYQAQGGKFDYNLPQNWLNDFVRWCESQGADHLSYHLILSTTVWDYSSNRIGIPLSACREVAEAIRDYVGSAV